MKKWFILFIFAIFLVSCAKKYDDLTLKFKEKSFILECDKQNFTLFVSENGMNFSLFDALFTPIVSRDFKNGVFKNAKFLPPNSKYDELFYEVLKNINKTQFDFFSKNLNCKIKVSEI